MALEPALYVFYRAAERKVTNIRVFSADCELDAGGRPVIWLTGVRPEESVALLRTFIHSEINWREHDDRRARVDDRPADDRTTPTGDRSDR